MKALLSSAVLCAALCLPACSRQAETPPAEAPQTEPHTAAQAPVRDQAALDALSRMGAYLRTLERFQIQADTVIDEVADNGQKLQFAGAVTYKVRRPDGLYVETKTDRRVRQFTYDGHTFTIYAPRQNFYAQAEQTGTLAELATRLADRFDIHLPLVDLFYWGTDQADPSAITSASVIGFARINGADCDQYAFRQDGVDWQIWIERGERPLPRKLVITTRDGDANPQYAATLHWTLNPSFAPATFTFTPPREAHLIRINTREAS
jgi:hypothetical protein